MNIGTQFYGLLYLLRVSHCSILQVWEPEIAPFIRTADHPTKVGAITGAQVVIVCFFCFTSHFFFFSVVHTFPVP